jgi:hypothetical protein
MQEIIYNVSKEINRVVSKPPSRPIRLMFFENKSLYGIVINSIREKYFVANEILNVNSFFESEVYDENIDELTKIENKYGISSGRFQTKLSEIFTLFLEKFCDSNKIKKLLIMEDEELYNYEFNPLDYISRYLASDDSFAVQANLPIVWVTIGKKDPYEENIYHYYKTEQTEGRRIKITNSNFVDCIYDYKIEY